MANRFLSNIRINDAYTFPASDGTSGQVIGTDGAGNLSFINIESEAGSTVIYKDNFSGDNSTVTFELAHVVSDEVVTQVYMDGVYQNKDTYIVSGDQITFDSAPPTGVEIEVISFNTVSTQGIIAYNAKNSTGSTIAAGTAVMAVGTDGNSGHILIAPMVADGSVEPKYFMGVTADEVLNGEYVDVVHFGVIGKINTSSFSDGDVLWLDPANNGGFTVTEPNAPSIKMAAAIVLNSGTNGKIFVRVQGNEGLHELHDVHIENLANQDILVYNTTQGYWENSKTLGDITTGNITTDGTVDGVDVSAFKAAYDVHTHVEGDITDFGNYLTNITHDTVNNKLVVTTRDAATFDVDLSQYIDDTNLARLTSGSLDAGTGIATFTRDDATTFTVDFSALFDDTDTNDFLTGASFNTTDGVLTLNVSNQTDVTVDLDGRYLESYTETDPTVPSHVKTISTTDISNWNTAYGWGDHSTAGYLTSYTETDTLATVTARGASTTGGITVNGTITLPQNPVGTTYGNGVSTVPSYMIQQGAGDNDGIRLYAEAGVTNDVRFIFEVVDDIETGDTWVFRNKKTYTDYLANEVVKISGAGDITASGTLSASGYNNSNWDTAYGWGDHSTAGYQAASSAITTSNIGSQSVDNSDKVDGYHASGLLRLGEPIFGAGTGEDTSGPIEFIRDSGTAWDDYIIKHGSTKGMFGKKGVGWHAHTDSSFHVMSSGWVSNFGVNSDGTTVSRTSSRAPIFYDLDNTGHYVNPAGDSYFSQITIANDTPIKFYGAGADTYTLSAIYCNSTNWVLEAPLKSNSGSGVHVPIYLTWRGGYSAQGGVKIDDGYTEISGSMRSPIFYDSNDTSYYLNPNSTSKIYGVELPNSHRLDKIKLYSGGSEWIGTSSGQLEIGGGSISFNGANNSGATTLKNGGNTWMNTSRQIFSPLYYDDDDTSYYVNPSAYTNLYDANLELRKSYDIDLRSLDSNTFYPITIGVGTSGVWLEVQVNLNTGVAGDWSTHPSGFTLNVMWRTNGSGWGTTAIRRQVFQYHEQWTNKQICGGIGQLYQSSREYIYLRGGGRYNLYSSRPISYDIVTASTAYNNQTIAPISGSSPVNNVWESFAGSYYDYSDYLYTIALYDRNNTAYYLDPHSTSTLESLNMTGKIDVGTFSQSQTNSGEAWIGRAADRAQGSLTVQLGTGTGRKFEVVDYAWTTVEFEVNDSGDAFAANSFKAPLFYNHSDTSYYLDLNGYSRVNTLGAINPDDAQGLSFRASHEVISGEGWCTAHYAYNNNDGFLFLNRDTTAGTARPVFHIGGKNNASYAGYGANDSIITLAMSDGVKNTGSTYAGRALSNTSYYTNIIKTTTGTVFRDAQSRHDFTGSVYMPFLDIDKTSANGPGMDLTFSGTNSTGILIRNNTGTTTSAVLFYYSSAPQGARGSITVSSTSTAYNTSSDYRLKENVVPMTGSLERVDQLNPSRFNFIGDDKTVDGFLAHEAAEVVPEAVTGTKDEVDSEGNPIYQGIDQAKLVPLLVGAIQELKAEVEALKQKLNGTN